MPTIQAGGPYQWLANCDEAFPAMFAAIETARISICLEMYTVSGGSPGERFREALMQARRRGVKVRVLVDAAGSFGLPDSFWEPLRAAGAEVRLFNPLTLKRASIRDHRKLLICDGSTAFIGGFNLAPEYEGDGVTRGWCDLGLKIAGPLVPPLAESFDEMFGRAEFLHKRFVVLRRSNENELVIASAGQALFSGPGRGPNPIQRALHRDLATAREVDIMVAYFLPTRRLRRDLMRVAHRGGRVRLILAGRSDVSLSQLAARSLYHRFLKGGVEIFEYQPQVLHAKLIMVDDAVFVGSSNLDQRSLRINYELMVRLEGAEIAGQARQLFMASLKHSTPVTREKWRRSRTLWARLKQRWAYFLLVHIDSWIARRQWLELPD